MRRRRERCVLVSALRRDEIEGAFAGDADEVVVDLAEIPSDSKDDFLRLAVVDAIGAEHAAAGAIQINRRGTRWFDEDIVQIVMAVEWGIDCLVVPAAESAEDVRAAAELLTEIEAEFPVAVPIGLEARIDSEKGLAAVEEIAAASDRLEALVLDLPGPAARERAQAAAAAAGVEAVAGPDRDGASLAGAWFRAG